MKLSNDEIQKLAHLSRLNLPESDIERYRQEMEGIFTLVEQMEQFNTDNIEPMYHPNDMQLRLREDEVTETNQREQFQQVAPAVEDGLYLVPQVIE